jgi:hypothetical protein
VPWRAPSARPKLLGSECGRPRRDADADWYVPSCILRIDPGSPVVSDGALLSMTINGRFRGRGRSDAQNPRPSRGAAPSSPQQNQKRRSWRGQWRSPIFAFVPWYRSKIRISYGLEKASPATPGCEINVKVPGSTGTVFHLEPDPGDGMRHAGASPTWGISPPFQRLELEHERAVTVPSGSFYSYLCAALKCARPPARPDP